MKNIRISILLLLSMAGLSSCEDVIEYDLQNTVDKVVVEGLVTDQPGPYTIRLSRTNGYLNQSAPPVITGAQVYISDNTGLVDTLTEQGNGIYLTTPKLQGTVGRTYTLRFTTGGKEYTASSLLRPVAHLDSLTFEFHEEKPEIDSGYSSFLHFQDPAGKGEFYKFDIWINGQKRNDIAVVSDEIYDGADAKAEIGYLLQLGDTMRLDMYSLDKPAYDFWNGMQILFYQGGSPFDSPPANAPTNVSNGAIGFFGASAKSSQQRVVGE
jgi:hypothetical protein